MAPHENTTNELSYRGVTLCAGQIGISLDFVHRLLHRMHELGLNELLWEMKMRSTRYPAANTWHYYTVSEVHQVLEWANELGIQVIPEINAPGHMGIWLEAYPQFALWRGDGTPGDRERLDITNPQAVQFYLDLVDEYLEVFTPQYTKYWHLGADEYMIHDSYDNYPQITEYARRIYGTAAAPYDVFNGFINTVNAFVLAKGYGLRIWNDGIHDSPVVKLDKDIVVEYWKNEGLQVAELARRGHRLVNATEKLYWSRSHEPYRVNARALWESTWDGREFIGGQRLSEAQRSAQIGLRVSLWPDTAYYQTEHEVWTAIQDSLVLVAALGADGGKGDATWKEACERFALTATMPESAPGNGPEFGNIPAPESVSKSEDSPKVFAPAWPDQRVPEGIYRITQLDAVARGPWRVSWTKDQYVTLTYLASGRNLALCRGSKHLGIVTEIGVPVELCELAKDASWSEGWDTAEARNTQKWVVTPIQTEHQAGGVDTKTLAPHEVENRNAPTLTCTISPALTNQRLCAQGDIVAQYPPDIAPGSGEFTFIPADVPSGAPRHRS